MDQTSRTPPPADGAAFEQAAETRPRSFAAEFWQFARQNKRWWLTPILLILLLVGLLVVLGGTAAGPFVYTLF